MMVFMLASITDRELFRFHFNLFGFSIGFGLNSMEVIIPLAAVITDLAMFYALQSRLPVEKEQIGLHLFLPFAVTLTIGFTLRNIQGDMTGWLLLFITGGLLFLVLLFEYINCDPSSSGKSLSVIVLDSLCYAVFLLFIIALRANLSRLVITIPAVFILCFVVSLKIFSSHVISWNILMLSAVTGIVICFADTGLHYWPVNIISYGSLMFFWYYTFTNLIIGSDRNEPVKKTLMRILPVYMVPARFHQMEELPLSSSGMRGRMNSPIGEIFGNPRTSIVATHGIDGHNANAADTTPANTANTAASIATRIKTPHRCQGATPAAANSTVMRLMPHARHALTR